MKTMKNNGNKSDRSIHAHLSLKILASFILIMAILPLSAQEWQYNGFRNKKQKDAGFIGSEGGNWPQALAISGDGEFLMMGTDVAGLIRSTNGSELWEQANAGYTPRGNCALAIDPNNADRVLAVGGNSVPVFSGAIYHGVYLSEDRARTWSQVQEANICGYRDIREQVVWDASSMDATIGGSSTAYWSRANKKTCAGPDTTNIEVVFPGLYKSTNGGKSWSFLEDSAAYGQSILKVHPQEGFVYAAGDNGFFKSTDGGASFTRIDTDSITGMDVIASQPDRVYISKADGVYVSQNAGESFDKIESTSYPEGAFFVKVSPANPDRIMVQQEQQTFFNAWFYSEDGGMTWDESFIDESLAFLPQNRGKKMYPIWHPTEENTVWTVGGDWVTQSTDGGKNFQFKNNGNSMITQSGYFAFSVDNPDIVTITNQDYNAVITSTRGDTYKYLNTSNQSFGGFAYGGYSLDGETIFVRDSPGENNAPREVSISFDGGDTFRSTGDISAGKDTGYSDPTDNAVFFLGNLRSADAGQTWNEMADCDGVYTHNRNDTGELFGIKGSTVVRSIDKGVNWETVFSSIDGQELKDMAHDQINDIFYTVSNNDLFKYRREIDELTNITGNTPNDQLGRTQRFNTVAVDPVVTDIVYTGGSRDLYATDVAVTRSIDRGGEFIPLTTAPRHGNQGDGLDAGREVSCIRVHPVTRELWVGGGTYGMWKIAAPGANVPPTIEVKGDFSGTPLEAPFETEFEVETADADGSIARVEFFINGEKVSEATEAPYSFPLRLETEGTFVVQARAIDNKELYTSSEKVNFTLAAAGTYSENFDDGEAQDWNFVTGTWQVAAQKLTSPEITGGKTAIYEGSDFADFTYGFNATPSIGNLYGAYFQYQDDNNFYALRIDPNPKEFFLIKTENGTETELGQGTYTNGGPGTLNTVSVRYQSNGITVIVNGETVLEDVQDDAFASGKIGLFADFNPVDFDDVLVTPLDSGSSGEGGAPIGEIGISTGNHTWTTVMLERDYTAPVVVTGPLSYTGVHPATVRVRNVTPDSFQWRVDEWEYLDEKHKKEEIHYLVLEQGVHELANGTSVRAGTAQVGNRPADISLGTPFDSVPVVLAQVSTENEAQAVSVSLREITNDGFTIKLNEEENGGTGRGRRAHGLETVSYIVTEGGSNDGSGTGFFEAVVLLDMDYDRPWRDIQFQQSYDNSEKAFFAAFQSSNGRNPWSLRRERNLVSGGDSLSSDGIRIFGQEEKSKDKETNHRPESLGYLVFNALGAITGTTVDTENPGSSRARADWETTEEDSLDGIDIVLESNPLQDKAIVLKVSGMDRPNHEALELFVYDLSGNLMVESSPLVSEKVVVPVPDLFKGIYVVKVLLGIKEKSFKIIVE